MNIYVGNINYNTTEEELKSLFEEYGTVESVKLITDRDTGRMKGFGFVEMEDDEAADNAIEALNDSELDGRNLRIKKARPREERPMNGGGGRRPFNRSREF
jgi:RNA recognition motif-containing protein